MLSCVLSMITTCVGHRKRPSSGDYHVIQYIKKKVTIRYGLLRTRVFVLWFDNTRNRMHIPTIKILAFSLLSICLANSLILKLDALYPPERTSTRLEILYSHIVCVHFFSLFSHHNKEYEFTIYLLFLTTCFGLLSLIWYLTFYVNL
jgi:hypothetical protein